MNKDNAARAKGFIDETTGMRHPEEKILIWPVFDGHT